MTVTRKPYTVEDIAGLTEALSMRVAAVQRDGGNPADVVTVQLIANLAEAAGVQR
jgi:hypothetical protein